ncbi:hypothetical protein QAD02_002002 [Eretmocerus hayati]|uniref:Uncharacterized protein n=1 Tax=Eretmocerus hayati TaxID=131215 RepID=A0ACC2NIV6_9HYME|nr:hypothetical protein QAD02_002002 [Eretmocerus hayati]
MEKNPISFLQEYMMAKKKVAPNYIVIDERKGTHINSFIIRVECNGKHADGKGSSKKEAKTEAAKNMLKMLQLGQDTGTLTNKHPTLVTIPGIVDNRIGSGIANSQLNKSATYINYVGKLQEYVIHKTLPAPVYECKSVFGPSHLPTFTVSCKYDKVEELGTATTKKEAKNLAAQKMYERLTTEVQIVVPEVKIQSYLQSLNKGISQLQLLKDQATSLQQSAQRAKAKYPQLSKTKLIIQSAASNRLCKDYHTLLSDAFPFNVRKMAIEKLKSIIDSFCKEILSNDSFDKLKLVLKDLNLNLTESVVNNRAGTNQVLYGLKLDTNPVISEISLGSDFLEAKRVATFKLAETLSIMLGD